MNKIDTLIVGAGISGLTFAANCKKNYLIVEKEPTVGGLCRSFYKDGFVWDFAGHFFHFATPEIKQIFESKIPNDAMVKCIKNTNINYYNKIITYPFQMNIHQLPKEEFIDCLYDLFNKEEKTSYLNFEDMLYGKFGKNITEKFLKPYNENLYACNLNELDADAMGRFFPYANIKQIIDNMKKSEIQTYNSTFDYPKKGAQFFIDIICKMVNQDSILLNSEIEYINPVQKYAKINGNIIFYNNLINTIPLNHFIKLLPQGYAPNTINDLSCNKVLVFNLGFDKQATDTHTHWTYFPDKSINFYRVGYYSNILGSAPLSMYVEIGYKENDEICVNEQLNLTLNNLKKCNIITDQKLIAHNSLIINPGYVHITKRSIESVAKLKKKIECDGIYTIGRYGNWTYCSIEDCMIDAISLSKKINAK